MVRTARCWFRLFLQVSTFAWLWSLSVDHIVIVSPEPHRPQHISHKGCRLRRERYVETSLVTIMWSGGGELNRHYELIWRKQDKGQSVPLINRHITNVAIWPFTTKVTQRVAWSVELIAIVHRRSEWFLILLLFRARGRRMRPGQRPSFRWLSKIFRVSSSLNY